MGETGGRFFQTAIFTGAPHARKVTKPFDIVVGSGRKGQTYLYWKGDALFQLPISAWQASGWANSPGYRDGTADFDRPITQRCMECHGSYFESLAAGPLANRYNTGNFILGISCERCHGAGREHVALHKDSGTADAGSAAALAPLPKMVNPGNLPRDQQIEVCAQCHGGIGRPLESAFGYFPGQPLNLYLQLQAPEPNANVDVHGNQVALLARSRCYQSSGTLSCLTCHAPHEPEKTAASYSQHCLSCHKAEQCGEFAKLGEKIQDGCIDCHMPTQASRAIVFGVNGKQVRAQVRTHWIKVYGTGPEG